MDIVSDNVVAAKPNGFPVPVRPGAVAPAHEVVEPALLFEQVSKWYGPVIGVNQVTLELRPGITGLVGANGAGKSTLLRLATGQLRPDLGRVRVFGIDSWTAAAKRCVGYCPEVDAFYEEMSGRQFLLAMARLCGYDRKEAEHRTENALQFVGMADRAGRKLRGYSKGMRQRVKVAQALVHDPRVLVLDEPLSGVDPVGRQDFLELFRRLADAGKCLLVSSHELEELEKLTEQVAIMARGRIAAVGTVSHIRDRLDDHPLSILIEIDPAGSDGGRSGGPLRNAAGLILGLPDVVGIEMGMEGTLIARARNPRRFFPEFTRLVLEESLDVRRLETLDDSTHAVLNYLLGGGR